ncbi:MAG: NPCBM/NEW2 domain-containing protein [Bacteroidales bacterium]|nr:NPCBM/NEW2 domain-containing protein [Bacteroidales bacterium]
MKRTLLSLLLLAANLSAGAQVYLSKTYKPIEMRKYNPHYPGVSNEEDHMTIAGFRYTNGFGLRNGVLHDQAKEWAYAVFSLKGEYEKISFVLGFDRGGIFAPDNEDASIITIKADGRRIFDEVVRSWHAPREVVLDISGVDELRFDHLKGLYTMGFAEVKLWKKGQTPTPVANPLAKEIAKDKVNLIDDIQPHFLCHRGWSVPVTVKRSWGGVGTRESVRMNRIDYNSGMDFQSSQEFGHGISEGFVYFWLQKQFDKVSFLLGPLDANSRNAQGWFTVMADGKIIYEKLITQEDLGEYVVLDVAGVNVLSMHSGEPEKSDFLGGLHFGAVDIYAYKKGVSGIPTPGIANTAKDKISKFPNATRLCSSLEPYSVRGKARYDDIYFNGASSYYHFSMGGEQFDEGFILATGESFMDGNISAYVEYDLAGEFDWLSFTVGTLSKRRVLGEDRLMVYADDNLVLDVDVHCLWPNQKFTVPLNKCRRLKFAKPGTGQDKQTYIGVGDVMVFRGEPQDTAPFFYHRKPELPETADLIDLCEQPYFHYVGRYLSSLTNFDFNDCFKNGSSRQQYFSMRDGSQIYKGIMLETNVPPALAFEDITLNEAIFLFVVGAGSSISASNVAAATGVSAGAGLAGALAAGYSALNLVDKGHQSAVAAFNPFGAYETLTFTVDCKSPFVDTDLFGKKLNPDNPVKLDVFADMRKVGEFWLSNNMSATTYSVPIYGCSQLVFWLECGETRSGQYVLYDMTVSKTPLKDAPVFVPQAAATQQSANVLEQSYDDEVRPASVNTKAAKIKGKKEKKAKERIVWEHPSHSSRVPAIDQLIADTDEIWALTADCLSRAYYQSYRVNEDYVQSQSGRIFKAVSLVNAAGQRLSFKEVMQFNKDAASSTTAISLKIAGALIGVPSATLGLASLQGENLFIFPKVVKNAPKALNQCDKDLQAMVQAKEAENAGLQALLDSAVDVGSIASTDYVLLLPLAAGEKAPEGNTLQRLEYYRMN